MSEISVSLVLENNSPKLTILLNESKSITQNIADLQIKSRASEIFSDDLKNKKDSIDFINGVVITRVLQVKKNKYYARFIKIFEENVLEFFDTLEESSRVNNSSIKDLSNDPSVKVNYKVDHFKFSSNLVNLTDIKIEETLIYENYKKTRRNLSSGRIQRIISEVKSNKNFHEVDKAFFDIFTKSSLETKSLALGTNTKQPEKFDLKIASIGNFLSLVIEAKNINQYDFSLEEVVIFKRNNLKAAIIESKKFRPKEVKYKVQNNKIYIPLLDNNKFNYYSKAEVNLYLNTKVKIYNKNTLNIVSTKNKDFNLKGWLWRIC